MRKDAQQRPLGVLTFWLYYVEPSSCDKGSHGDENLVVKGSDGRVVAGKLAVFSIQPNPGRK